MHKVVVERRRWNPGPDKLMRRGMLPYELLPRYQGMRRAHARRKGFTDLLGPLRRWLQSNVGRPWNDVYSEACEVIKPDSAIRAHIKTHLLEFVERHTFMHEGRVCVITNHWYPRGIVPVTSWRFVRGKFYVHPETGMLHAIKRTSRKEWRRAQYKTQADPFRWLTSRGALKEFKGIWFYCIFEAAPPSGPFTVYDHINRKVVGRGELVRKGSAYLYCTGKRQLSKAELNRFGVKNSPGNVANPDRAQPSIDHASGPLRIVLCPDTKSGRLSFFDGSMNWVIAHNDVVAGSSPASGTKRRGSSVVEHVIPNSPLIRR